MSVRGKWLDLDALAQGAGQRETNLVINQLRSTTAIVTPVLERAGTVWQRLNRIAVEADRELERAGLRGSSELWSFIEEATGSRLIFTLMMDLARSADPDNYIGEWK